MMIYECRFSKREYSSRRLYLHYSTQALILGLILKYVLTLEQKSYKTVERSSRNFSTANILLSKMT